LLLNFLRSVSVFLSLLLLLLEPQKVDENFSILLVFFICAIQFSRSYLLTFTSAMSCGDFIMISSFVFVVNIFFKFFSHFIYMLFTSFYVILKAHCLVLVYNTKFHF